MPSHQSGWIAIAKQIPSIWNGLRNLLEAQRVLGENQAANLRSYRFLKAWNNAKSARRTNEANRPNKRQKNHVEREWHSKHKNIPRDRKEKKGKSFVHARFVSQSHVLKDFIHDQRNIMDLHLWIKLVMRADINFLSFRSSSSAVRQRKPREIKKCRRYVPEMVEFVKRQININGRSFWNWISDYPIVNTKWA